ncbi:MAG: DUF5050 domain-containing protein [Ignavibacteriaceae bacterium]|nr:DUF5050 domain-containing protein [Ignavibacteriaceae bacterium]
MKILNSLIRPTLTLFIVTTSLLFIHSCGLIDDNGHERKPELKSVLRIYSINTDGTNLKLLANGGNFILSQTGDTIFYINDYTVYSMDTDGSNKHQLSSYRFNDLWLSLNGKNICLSGTDYSYYFMNTDGSGLTKLTLPSSINFLWSWNISPAGDQILCTNRTGMYLLDKVGNNLKLLIDSSNSKFIYSSNFTSDGKSAIYKLNKSLKLINLNDGKDTLLFLGDETNQVTSFEVSQWNTILFTTDKRIYEVDLNNYSTSLLVQTGRDAHYSTNGKWVSYADNIYPWLYTFNYELKKIALVNLPLTGNFISNPRLTYDNSKIIFSADSSYYVRTQ